MTILPASRRLWSDDTADAMMALSRQMSMALYDAHRFGGGGDDRRKTACLSEAMQCLAQMVERAAQDDAATALELRERLTRSVA